MSLSSDALPFCRAALLLAFAGLMCGSLGCVSHLGGVIAAAPNVRKPDFLASGEGAPIPESVLGIDEHFRVQVGPPNASLSVCVLHPASPVPKATVLVVHGMGARSAWMLPKARALVDEGYRAVLVDLRGHGASTGKLLSYGLRESQDLSHVIDELERRDLLAGELGVYGISYGATTAIHLAAIDNRVNTVVAVAPFSDMRSEVSHYIRRIGLPGVGVLLPEATIQTAVDEAGELGGYEPDDADAAIAIGRARVPVLLIHGKADRIIPSEHSQRLHQSAPQTSQLVELRAAGHLSVWLDPFNRVESQTIDWFEKHLL